MKAFPVGGTKQALETEKAGAPSGRPLFVYR